MWPVQVTTSERVFHQLLREILSGILRPRDRLSERELVARFGVSRTPVREAIKRLFAKGFLMVGPKGVAVIRDITRQEVEELYAVRFLLERTAADLTVRNITSEEIARLEEINRRFEKAVLERDLPKMLDIKAEFHETTANATRNRWLAEILINLREKAYVVRYASWQDISHAEETIKVHEEMIDCLRRQDQEGYWKLVLDHIRTPLEMYRSRLVLLSPQVQSEVGLRVPGSPTNRNRRPR